MNESEQTPSAKDALSITTEEWSHFQHEDIVATRVVVLIMSVIFLVGVGLYSAIAFLTAGG